MNNFLQILGGLMCFICAIQCFEFANKHGEIVYLFIGIVMVAVSALNFSFLIK